MSLKPLIAVIATRRYLYALLFRAFRNTFRDVGDNVLAAYLAVIHGPVSHFQQFEFGLGILGVAGKAETGGEFYLRFSPRTKGCLAIVLRIRSATMAAPCRAGLDQDHGVFVAAVSDDNIDFTDRSS